MKKKLIIISIIFLALLGALLIFFKSGLYTKLIKEYQTGKVPGIVCIGDSLTHGTGGEGVAYPLYLQEMMEADGILIPVVNLGVGGENTLTIAGRMGALPFKTTEFTIRSDTEEAGAGLIRNEENNIFPLINGIDGGINPSVINGVEGTLWFSEDLGYTFKRSTEGDSVQVPEGTIVETYASKAYEDYIYILFMGENGGFDSTEELIAQQEAIVSKQVKNSGKYIIIGLTTGDNETRADIDKALEDRWGEHFINIRKYMTDETVISPVVELTDKDRKQIAKGKVPKSLRMDDIHYNETGYRLLATAVYEKMLELGYFKF